MNFLPYYDHAKFVQFVSKLKKDINDWQIVEVSLTGKTAHNTSYIARKLMDYFHERDGFVFICNSRDILVLVHMGKGTDGERLSAGITKHLPQYSCGVRASDVTAEGLAKFQIQIEKTGEDRTAQQPPSPLLTTRMEREERVVMIVEDDMFIRSVISGVFQPKGRVIELDSADNVVETYLEALPDILFLDIHLPGGSGIDLLSEILSFDDSAHVIIMSSDSVKDNVLSAKKLGARGFITKSFTPDKLEECYNKCPTTSRKPPRPPAATDGAK